MKTFTLILSLILVLFTPQAMAQQSDLKDNKSLLWRVSGKGLAKPSYLFGAIDFVCTDQFFFTKSMQDCLAKSDKICFSLNYGDDNLKSELRVALIDNHRHLKDYFTSGDYDIVKTYAQKKWDLNLDDPKIRSYRPLAIQPYIVKELLGCPSSISYDVHLIAEAKKTNKEILGIETIPEFIDKVDAAHFDDKIAQILTEMAKGSKHYHEFRSNIEQAYQQQDIQQLNILFKNTSNIAKADQYILLNNANKQLTDRMPALMNVSSVFFAVNPINMWGDEGIISMLKKDGYIVEAMY